ncbi:N-acetyltransferase [Coccidioides immitis RS]|uniref:N-acetyltransferase n=4 Tax=Coccidioides immitis TaxID=5501 RepID=J3KJD4_COCIM|nr:N-acetyltransferase [Coccidioides immitis RS]KMP01491.1 hypothetical protein CIRG_01630 [Coccidioides immitis RMSCC 2394]KMU88935.1 hypothetical protein CIHG_06736 [Coccidioides immitis H538.4]CBL43288.1 TPA: arylamine N-acetyltransferase 1 [Coccidioides immitis]EAS36168.3 N-acetyltransferase [Coccidioides immitis RS]CBL43289.1 TPA: arylamine N-acetyltransferase 1 [Coccidioides immitis]
MILPASHRPTLSRDQLLKYVSFIYQCDSCSAESQLSALEGLIRTDPLRGLTQLQQHHQASIPFSNLILHYSQHHSISLDPDVLFHKLVERGLGGYCVESTGFFSIVMRTLGFKLYTSAGRVSKGFEQGVETGEYNGWGHMVIIVTIGVNKYAVDVAFGPNGQTRPLLLSHGATSVRIAPAEARLVKESISANTDSEQKPWIFQIRSNAEEAWRAAYCFYEIEFLPSDYEVMNFSTSQSPRSIFTKTVICAKFLLNEAKDDIVGNLSLVKGTVKRNLNGDVEILQTLKNEAERVDALKSFFNVHLQPLEVRGIHGKITELKDLTATAF